MIAGTEKQDEIVAPIQQPWYKKTVVKITLVMSVILLTGVYLKPAISAWQQGALSVKQRDILTAKVELGDIVRDIAVNGKVIAAHSPQMYSTETGQVTFVAKPGQSVAAGETIAHVTSPELNSLIAQQQANLEQLKLDSERGALQDKEALLDLERSLDSANVKLVAAKRENERAQISFSKQVMSQVDFAKIQDALLEAELFYNHAKKRVELSKERLAFERKNRDYSVKKQQIAFDELKRRQGALTISSPVNGIVGNWLVDDKDKVAANTALMTVVDLSEFEAQLFVPEFYADDLGLGLAVSMKLSDKQLSGEIIAISPEIVNNQIQVKVSLPANESIKLRQNQRLAARIEFEKKANVLKVKRGPFLGSSGGDYVYLIDQTGLATKTPIVTGLRSVEYVEVLGLTKGAQIIISDYSQFKNTQNLLIEQL